MLPWLDIHRSVPPFEFQGGYGLLGTLHVPLQLTIRRNKANNTDFMGPPCLPYLPLPEPDYRGADNHTGLDPSSTNVESKPDVYI